MQREGRGWPGSVCGVFNIKACRCARALVFGYVQVLSERSAGLVRIKNRGKQNKTQKRQLLCPWAGDGRLSWLLPAVPRCDCRRLGNALVLRHGNPRLPQFLSYCISLAVCQQRPLLSSPLPSHLLHSGAPEGTQHPACGAAPAAGCTVSGCRQIQPFCPLGLQLSRGLKTENKTKLSENLVFVLFP